MFALCLEIDALIFILVNNSGKNNWKYQGQTIFLIENIYFDVLSWQGETSVIVTKCSLTYSVVQNDAK